MDTEKDREQRIEEKFDKFIRQEIFNASNDYRKEHGLPLLTEDEMEAPDADETERN